MKKFYERKKAFFVVFFLVVILIIFSASLAYSADEWTIMVYIDGDNDLEDAAWDDLEEMETVGSISGVNVVVQLDDWQNDTETWRYLISGADMGADKPYYMMILSSSFLSKIWQTLLSLKILSTGLSRTILLKNICLFYGIMVMDGENVSHPLPGVSSGMIQAMIF